MESGGIIGIGKRKQSRGEYAAAHSPRYCHRSIHFRTFIAHEEYGYRTGTGMTADDGADVTQADHAFQLRKSLFNGGYQHLGIIRAL